MFKKLHIQLTFFCTLISGLILILMSLICISFSESEERENYFSNFQLKTTILIHQVESQSTLSFEWLSQIKADTQFDINIQDNGTELAIEKLSPCPLDDKVFSLARETAREKYNLLEEPVTHATMLTNNAEFELHTNTQDYYACIALIPKNSGVLNFAILYPLTGLYHSIFIRRLLFFGADILGVILLGILFWFYTRHIIQPLIINRRKQTDFITAASHELRSPLALILSCLSSMDGAPAGKIAHFSKTMKQEGKRMSRLIDDMLTLSSSDNSHFPIDKSNVELDTLVLSAYEKFEPLALAKNISFDFVLPDTLSSPYNCDKERMEQVLSILLDNALSYTPVHGRISISLEETSDKLIIRIADNGVGIPDSEKEAIFDRFYRCDKAHRDKTHFGLGLCIAQEIIHMHKGKIWCDDTPGGGATFVIMFRL